ncbi:MAG: hypothetical protein KJ597_06295 [Nanoarchaeota archaeon]|nr:hypothetical protein [Nanoarchaeota archaeon]MBU1623157.1 hypothetical protein [Nanoarchaeota archaeon]
MIKKISLPLGIITFSIISELLVGKVSFITSKVNMILFAVGVGIISYNALLEIVKETHMFLKTFSKQKNLEVQRNQKISGTVQK